MLSLTYAATQGASRACIQHHRSHLHLLSWGVTTPKGSALQTELCVDHAAPDSATLTKLTLLQLDNA